MVRALRTGRAGGASASGNRDETCLRALDLLDEHDVRLVQDRPAGRAAEVFSTLSRDHRVAVTLPPSTVAALAWRGRDGVAAMAGSRSRGCRSGGVM